MSSAEGVRVEAQLAVTRVRGGSGAANSQQQLAWQREMERAQFGAWFKPPPAVERGMAAPIGGAARPEAPASSPDRTRQVPAEEGRVSNMARMMLFGSAELAGAAGEPSPQCEDIIPAASPAPFAGLGPTMDARLASPALLADGAVAIEPPRAPVVRWLPPAALAAAPGVEAEVPAAAERASSPPAEAPPAAEPQALRLHAEMTPHGPVVWIGMRADAPALQTLLPQIVADLQRSFQTREAPLHRVVCNGRLLWRDGRFVSGGDRRDPRFDPFQPRKT